MQKQRKLGYWEFLCKASHEDYKLSGAVLQVAKFEGTFDLDKIKMAIEFVKKKHPLLNSFFKNEAGETLFDIYDSPELPLSINTRIDDDHWKLVSEKEMSMDFEAPFLWRANFLFSQQKSELVLLFHHAICDAISTTQFVKDFLEYYKKMGKGIFDRSEPPLILKPNVEQLIPNKKEIENPNQNEIVSSFNPVPFERNVPLKDRHSKNIFMSLPATDFERLIRKCKEENVTLNGVFTAAILLAINGNPESEIQLWGSSAINLRNYSTPEIGNEDFGCFVMMAHPIHNFPNNESFWTYAKICSRDLHQLIDSFQKDGFLPLNYLCSQMNQLLKAMYSNSIKKGQFTLGPMISNLGIVDIPCSFGSIKLSELYFSTVQLSGTFCLGLHILTFQKRLSYCISYPIPLMSSARANEIASQFQTILLSNCLDDC